MSNAVRIVCDAENHPKKRPVIFVREFEKHETTRHGLKNVWLETDQRRSVEAGVLLLGDERQGHGPASVARTINALTPHVVSGDGRGHRVNYPLTCRHCRIPYEYKWETLTSALDHLESEGFNEVSLAFLAKTVQGMA